MRKLHSITMIVVLVLFSCGPKVDYELENKLTGEMERLRDYPRKAHSELCLEYRVATADLNNRLKRKTTLLSQLDYLKKRLGQLEDTGSDTSDCVADIKYCEARISELDKDVEIYENRLNAVLRVAKKYNTALDTCM